ncbi:YolD-like family protein [Tepidibacillus infernus]|uniref:YolD-like family protein n=1 Tax=Tepidibacillus TaxID=1494427 RepID=UPI00085327C5|nr:YolD-like family protein [Tepidibacillus sp. HK-1]GBF11091.1 yolD-like protein [Tepidibacillus sp. HK-1]
MNRGNLLWTGSRMMLTEHRQLLNKRLRDINKKQKPLLDEQQKEQMVQIISEAMVNDLEVIITLFDPYHEKRITGKVLGIDPLLRRLQLGDEQEYSWIKLEDMIDIALK